MMTYGKLKDARNDGVSDPKWARVGHMGQADPGRTWYTASTAQNLKNHSCPT